MRVLVLCDDRWHPASTVRMGLDPIEKDKSNDLAFDWIEDAQDWSEEKMAGYSVVILTKSNNISSKNEDGWMTDKVEGGFLRYLQAGNGLLVIHSGTAGYEKQSILRGITGGTFANHPEQCEIMVTVRPENPFGINISPFTIFDEHYMMNLDDETANVFLTTSSAHGAQPAGWTRSEGAGRVCVLTPGHNLEVWLEPNYQELIRKSIFWCGKFI